MFDVAFHFLGRLHRAESLQALRQSCQYLPVLGQLRTEALDVVDERAADKALMEETAVDHKCPRLAAPPHTNVN